jgi:peptide/nickel transport system substrate-binding protein
MKREMLKRINLWVVLLVISTMVVACGPGTPAPVTQAPTAGAEAEPTTAPEAEPTSPPAATGPVVLRVSQTKDPPSLDPAKTVESAESHLLRDMMYETLVDYEGASTNLKPNLAASWEVSEDGRVYTLSLQDGVTYSDGSPFNADAVKYTWERYIGVGESASTFWKPVESIEVIDELTVRMTLKYGFGGWLNTLAGANCAVIGPPRSYIEEHATADDPWAEAWLNENGMGTGPYMLEEWRPNEQITFVKNPNYWRGWEGKHVDEILVMNIPEPLTGRQLLEAGETDLNLEAVPADWIDELEANPDVEVVASPDSAVIFYLFLNTQNPPLDDVRVRRAVFSAFSFDAAINDIWNGRAGQPNTILPPWMACDDPDAPRFEYDLEQAKQLLAEAGIEPGELVIRHRQNLTARPIKTKYVLLLSEGLSQIGVTLDIQDTAWPVMMEWSHLPRAETAPYDAMGYWFWGTVMDPDVWFTTLLSCDAIETVYNSSRYCDPEIDRLIEQARAEADPSKRCEIYNQLHRIVYDQAIVLPAVLEPGRIWYRTWLKNYIYRPALENMVHWYDLYIEGRPDL